MPRTPQEQAQMAPQVYNFIRNRGYQQEGFFENPWTRTLGQVALVGGGLALANALNKGGGGPNPPNTPPSAAAALPTTPVTPLPPTIGPNLGGMGGSAPSGLPSGGGNSPVSSQTLEATWEDQGREMPVVQTLDGTEIYRYDPSGALATQTPGQGLSGNMGSVGSLTTDLNISPDRSDLWASGETPINVVEGGRRGFGPAPAPRVPVEGLENIEFSMKPPIQQNPSFLNPTGNWGVGDTANLLGSTINFAVDHGPTIIDQGGIDIGKGVRDLRKGYDDVSTVVGGIYDAGAATRGWHDENLVPAGKRIAGIFMTPQLPTTRPSGSIETGSNSILNDNPDLIQPGTGSDEGPNKPNHVIHGAVDRQGNPFPMSTRVNAPSGVDRAGVPIGYIPQIRERDISPDANVPDPVEYQWYGGQKPRQGTMDEATEALRSKHAEWYEPQRLRDEMLPDAERVGEATVEAPPEAEAFHGLKQFVRGLTGQDSPVEYETESSRQELLDNPNASKEALLGEMNRRREGEMAQDGPNKAAYDAKQRLAKKTALMRDINSLVENVQSAPPEGYEAYQEFDPKPAKMVPYISKVTGKPTGALVAKGGGSGVEYIGLQDDGDRFMEISFHNKNKAKQTPGGYVFNSYQDATGPSYRDALVTPVADSRITSGAIGDQGIGTTVSDEVMNEKLAKDEREEETERTVKQWLDDEIFGYGEDQVSPTKFAREAKIGQDALQDFVAKNRDRLKES
jgi:hypothetical protein